MARPLTITAYGNAQVSSAQSKFGGESLLLDGTNDYLIVTDDGTLDTFYSGFDGVASSFMIEMWIRPNWTKGSAPHTTMYLAASTDLNWYLRISDLDGTPNIDIRTFVGGNSYTLSSSAVNLFDGSNNPVWSYVRWTHNGGSASAIYFNTNRVAFGSPIEAPLTTDNLIIGADYNSGSPQFEWQGYIDEFRFRQNLNTTDRNTSATTITVPTASFAPNINDDLLLIHFDGTNGSTTFTDDVGVQASANLTASSAIVEADGRTFLRNTIELPPVTTALTATAVDDPSMVFLGNDVYTWDDLDIWDTDYLDDGRWVVWEILPTAFSLTADSLLLKRVEVDLETSLALYVSAERLPGGSSDLNTVFSLTATALNLDLASADLESSFTATASAGIELNAEAALSLSTELSVSALNLDLAEIQIADLFTMDVTAGVILDAQADLNTAFSLTATALNLDIAAALLAFDFAIEATALNLRRAQASLAVSTELTAIGNKFIVGQVEPMTMSFAVTTDADNFNIAAALLAFNFEITPRAGLILEPNELYDYTWDSVPSDTWDTFLKDQWEARGVFQDSQFTLAPLGGLLIDGAADLTALATELTVGERLPGGSAALELSFESNIKATLIPSVLPFDLPVTTDLTASADLFVGGKADLEAFATELVVGERLPGGSADLTVNTELSAFAGVELNARAALEVFGFQFSEGRLSDVRGQANLQFAFQSQFEGDLRLLPSELVYKILRDQRKWTILGETRHYDVLPENRDHIIDDESTTLVILPESRVLDVEEMSA
jgi:hypothetical protein